MGKIVINLDDELEERLRLYIKKRYHIRSYGKIKEVIENALTQFLKKKSVETTKQNKPRTLAPKAKLASTREKFHHAPPSPRAPAPDKDMREERIEASPIPKGFIEKTEKQESDG